MENRSAQQSRDLPWLEPSEKGPKNSRHSKRSLEDDTVMPIEINLFRKMLQEITLRNEAKQLFDFSIRELF